MVGPLDFMGEPINHMLEDQLRGASTLNLYKYSRLKAGWIMSLIFPSYFLRDATLMVQLQERLETT